MSNPPRHAERSAEGAPQGANRSAKSKHLVFRATIIRGAGRGKTLGTPTFNLALEEIPGTLTDGVYAVYARVGGSEPFKAVMHFGPRPTFDGSRSCEVHLLERAALRLGSGQAYSEQRAVTLTVEVRKRLRDVKRFETPEALKEQIAKDIADATLHFRGTT